MIDFVDFVCSSMSLLAIFSGFVFASGFSMIVTASGVSSSTMPVTILPEVSTIVCETYFSSIFSDGVSSDVRIASGDALRFVELRQVGANLLAFSADLVARHAARNLEGVEADFVANGRLRAGG